MESSICVEDAKEMDNQIGKKSTQETTDESEFFDMAEAKRKKRILNDDLISKHFRGKLR